MVGWGEHKVVLDESGFRAYCVEADRGLKVLSVVGFFSRKDNPDNMEYL